MPLAPGALQRPHADVQHVVEHAHRHAAWRAKTCSSKCAATSNFQAIHDAIYSLPPTLEAVAGSYSGNATLLVGALNSTLTISLSGGTITGVVVGSRCKLHVVAPNVERTVGLLFVGVKPVE